MELRGELTAADAQEALRQLLALQVRRVSTLPLLPEAWTMRHNVTVADAPYVIIARRLGVAFVTGDHRLARVPGLDVEVITSSSPSR
jgi:predicted nucleic acid-binding protein